MSRTRYPEWCRPPRKRRLRRLRAHHPEAVPGVDQPRPFDYDSAMREAATKFEQCGVAGRGGSNLARVSQETVHIAFVRAMQVPVGRIVRNINGRYHARRMVYRGEQCQAVAAHTLEPRHVMIGCAKPAFGFGNNRRALLGSHFGC